MQALDLSLQTLQTVLNHLAVFLPKLLGALILLAVGLIIAKVLRAGVPKLLQFIRFQHMTERSGVEAFLRQAHMPMSLSSIIAALVYWLVILLTIAIAANVLELTVVAELFNRAVLYLPNAIGAVFVMVLGILAARFVNRLLFAFLHKIRFGNALVVSTLAELAITVFAVFLALGQLFADSVVLKSAFQIGFGALALALAIAFGMAGRERAAQLLKSFSNHSGPREGR